MIQSSISLSLEVQPCIKKELTFRNRRHHRLVRKRGSKLTVKPGKKRQTSLHRGTTWVTSVSPNAKLTLSPVNQIGKSSVVPLKFRREIARGSHSGKKLDLPERGWVWHLATQKSLVSSPGGAKFGALSQAWPLVLTLFSLQACDGGDFEKLVRF